MNDQQNVDEEPIRLPAILFQSFLLVAGAYMLNLVLLGLTGFGLMATLFPDSLELINSKPEEFNRIFEESPEKSIRQSFSGRCWLSAASSVSHWDMR